MTFGASAVLARRALLLLLALAGALQAAAESEKPLLRFGVIGDSGTGSEDQRRVARQMEVFHEKHPWKFVLMLGDNIYFEGHPKHFDNKFKDVYRNLMADGVEFHATLGNHDVIHPAARNGMAQVEDEAFGYAGNKPEYVFGAGPELPGGQRLARFICLNSVGWLEAIEENREQELDSRRQRLEAWLEKSGGYRWNILYMHHPLYSFVEPFNLFGLFGHGSYQKLRAELEPRLAGRVDAAFAGHDHFYMKVKRQKGVHYFVSGAAGKLVVRGADKDHPKVEFAAREFHFMDIALTADAFRYQAINDHGEVIHAGEFPKSRKQDAPEAGKAAGASSAAAPAPASR